MLIRKPDDIPSSEITPERDYLNRRHFLKLAGGIGVAAAGGALVPRLLHGAGTHEQQEPDKPNSYEDITSYNNYYEFGTDKEDPKDNAQQFRTSPWSITVGGLCRKPGTLSLDDFLKGATHVDRVYRLRCVEAWSMVIPWNGYVLADLLKRFEPSPSAKYVKFTAVYDPAQMPGQRRPILQWPYVEGLRMDEAMHPLTLLATGLYGKPLPKQDGAPIRLVVPWKYGFKGIKAITKIEFVDQQPMTTWMLAAPDEYGFYANVNPTVDHPRWTQSRERRIGEFRRRPTLMFNGYADQVASLYTGMDLRKNF
ncbi:MAG TPA: protein-methionine-sulfoxide reductase catalytic subunit MsrP [Gemmatimonadaceae bacterium]|jgi:sulfoxide reductase catalytic subunit YedY|nr:protein-methionine-sulfoxide reductase catalytic subunit MsrP [Gemmatimonadaceae bacterium]